MAIVTTPNSTQTDAKGSLSRIGLLDIDVVVTETHNLNSQVTDKTVEDGSTVSDNIIILPTSLTVDLYLTSTPTISCYDKLDILNEIRLSREVFDVVTSIGVYENMFFDGSITINRASSNSDSINARATLKEIFFIESEIVFVPREAVFKPSAPVGGDDRQRAATKDQGKVAAKEGARTSAIVGLLSIQKR